MPMKRASLKGPKRRALKGPEIRTQESSNENRNIGLMLEKTRSITLYLCLL